MLIEHLITRIENAQADGATSLALYSPVGAQIDMLQLEGANIAEMNDSLAALAARVAALEAERDAALYSGIITALAVVRTADQETLFREIVNLCDEVALIAVARENDELEFSGLVKYGYVEPAP